MSSLSSSSDGILAALAAPLTMTIGFFVWDKVWLGSAFGLNLFKCCLASLGFFIVVVVFQGWNDWSLSSVGFLILSSTIGILIGDWTWLEALKLLRARRVILVDAIKPFLAALLGWIFLGEDLPPPALGGMVLTVFGVLWVSLEKDDAADAAAKETCNNSDATSDGDIESSKEIPDPSFTESNDNEELQTKKNACGVDDNVDAGRETACHETMHHTDSSSISATKASEPPTRIAGVTTNTKRRMSIRPQDMRKGYCYAALNVILDTFGSLLTKEYGVGMTTWEINLIRFGFAGIVMLAVSLTMYSLAYWNQKQQQQQQGASPSDSLSDTCTRQVPWYGMPRMSRSAWGQVSLGVAFVTFLTPALSNYALFQIALALALTLTSVGPLYALPLAWLVHGERPTLRSTLGVCVAVAGVVVLSVWGTA